VDQEHQLEQRDKAVAAPNARLTDGEHELQLSEEALTEGTQSSTIVNIKFWNCRIR
jgi:hypothetical protein